VAQLEALKQLVQRMLTPNEPSATRFSQEVSEGKRGLSPETAQ
jgi:hypothetical protein